MNMTTPLYDLTVPVFVRALHNLSTLLDKGASYTTGQSKPAESLMEARIYADMHPLAYQVQRVSDSTKGCIARLSGQTPPAMADDEASFDELQARIAATIAYIESVPREAIDGKETATVVLKTPSATIDFTGISYVLDFAIPNIFFHVSIAYALLRQQGVPVGKLDYLGASRDG
jgi:hypothetical protein